MGRYYLPFIWRRLVTLLGDHDRPLVVVTRLESTAQRTCQPLRSLGIDCLAVPLMRLEWLICPGDKLADEVAMADSLVDIRHRWRQSDAVVLTSMHAGLALRRVCSAEQMDELCAQRPVFAMGDATAQALGWAARWCRVGDGRADGLVAMVAQWAGAGATSGGIRLPTLLYVGGMTVSTSTGVALSRLPVVLKKWPVYRTVAVEKMPDIFRELCNQGRPLVVAVYSVRTAKALVSLAQGHYGGARWQASWDCWCNAVAVCLNDDVAEALSMLNWRNVLVCGDRAGGEVETAMQGILADQVRSWPTDRKNGGNG